MTMSLQNESICSDAEIGARSRITFGAICTLVLILVFGGWSIFSVLSGAVISDGAVEVQDQRQVVQHLTGGTVDEILVREGDVVRKGDIIMRIDGTTARSDLAIVQDQLIDIHARIARLEAERSGAESIAFPADIEARRDDVVIGRILEGQQVLFDARRETRDQQIGQLKQREDQIAEQNSGLESQIQSLKDQVAIYQEELDIQEGLLAKGLTAASRVRNLKAQIIQAEGQQASYVSQIAANKERITEVEIQISGISADMREKAQTELRDLAAKAAELDEQETALQDKVDHLELRAPASGMVQDMKITTTGAVIQPAQPLLYIIPQDLPLHVAAQVQPTDIDQIRIGQMAELKFPAFASKDIPEVTGTITKISPDVFNDERTGRSWYRVELEVTPEGRKALGDNEMTPGMPVQAFIRTSEHSPMSYLLKPAMKFFDRTFREAN